MDNQPRHPQLVLMKQSFFDSIMGFLSVPQFPQLEDLLDLDSPHFVQDIFALFFRDTTRQFHDIDNSLFHENKDKESIESLLYRLKGSVVSLGALKMLNEVEKMRGSWEEGDMEGTMTAYKQMKQEHLNLKDKIEPYFQLLRQVEPSESAQLPK